MGLKNIKLQKLNNQSPSRKIAMGSWTTAKDPSVYGLLEIDMSRCLPYMEERAKRGIKITPAHLVGKAIAYCLNKHPEMNGFIRGSKISLREDVKLFYQVNIPSGKGASESTLSGVTVDKAQDKHVDEVSNILISKSKVVRESSGESDLGNTIELFKYIPWFLSKFFINLSSFLTYRLNLNLSFLGLPKDPFGSVMITNIGSLGIEFAFAPLVPYSRVPLVICVGKIVEKPWVVNHNVVVRPIMKVAITFDHRMIDGHHASLIAKDFETCFSEPEKYFFN